MSKYKVGDIIGFSSYSCLGFWINIGTLGVPFRDLSHIGIIGPDGFLYESTSLLQRPCAILGNFIKGTQAQHPTFRIRAYKGAVYHYPLNVELQDGQCQALCSFLTDNLAKPYDAIGAFRARTLVTGRVIRWLMKREENLASLFCSEYVMGAYSAAGLHPIDNASNWSPNRAARVLCHEGIIGPRQRLH